MCIASGDDVRHVAVRLVTQTTEPVSAPSVRMWTRWYSSRGPGPLIAPTSGSERGTNESSPSTAQIPTAASHGLGREGGRARSPIGDPPSGAPRVGVVPCEVVAPTMPSDVGVVRLKARDAPCRAINERAKDAGRRE